MSTAQKQVVHDALWFSREMGFKSVLFNGSPERPIYYAKLLTSWKIAHTLLAMYPMSCRGCFSKRNPLRSIVDRRLLDFLGMWKPNPRAILFVEDLPIKQALALNDPHLDVDEGSYEIEEKIFRLFDVLCVYNETIRDAISQEYGIARENFVQIELPFRHTPTPMPRPQSSQPHVWKLVCVGNGKKSYSGEWALGLQKSDDVSYEFIGPNWEWISDINRRDLTYRVNMESQDLCDYLSEHAHFGIVAYSDKINEYSKYTVPSKFTTYLSLGLPVLVSSRCESVSHLVRKYGLGLSMNSFDDIPTILQGLGSEYEAMRRRCAVLAEKVRSGYFFKLALVKALSKIHTEHQMPQGVCK
jgi:hypothetical protein